MKIERLEAHDRLLHLKQDQALNVAQGAEDCLKKNRLSIALQEHSPYIYLFAHPRTADDGVNKKMMWQPRLTKPKAQTNSYLFRAKSNSDEIEVCWLLPPREIWAQYQKGNVTEHQMVLWSITQFQSHRDLLEKAYPDDLNDEQIKNIYLAIGQEMDEESRIKKLYSMPESSEPF
jgi:hypothetical protein